MSRPNTIIEHMYDCLNLFAEPTRAWFNHAFAEPTDVQRKAWPVIATGRNALIIAPTGSGKTLAAFLSAIDGLMKRAAEDDSSQSGKRGSGCSHARGVSVLYISPLKALGVDVAKNLMRPLEGIAQELGSPLHVTVAIRSGDTPADERRRIVSHPPDILVTTPESLYLLLTSKARKILRTVTTVIVDEVHAIAGTKRGAHLAVSLERLDALVGGEQLGSLIDVGDHSTVSHVQRIGLSATVRPVGEVARFLGGARQVDVVNEGMSPTMDVKIVEPLPNMQDLSSSNVKHRAGGVDGPHPGEQAISGVTPAMRRLAQRKGLTHPDGDGIGYQAIVGAPGDGAGGMGAASDGSGGSIWPAIESSVLDEVLAHRTTLVFVNSRGLAEKLTARLNDLYAQRTGNARQSHEPLPVSHEMGSPEGRENFGKHYDAVVGSTTMLVGSHNDNDAIAMAHHGSVSKDRRKRIEEDLKQGRLRCVVATSSLELGIDMGSVDLVIQIAPPLSVASGLQRVGRADHRVGGVSHALFYPLTREQIIGATASVEAMRAGDIEATAMPRNPLDILAQHTVAAASMEDLNADHWYRLIRRAAPFATLTREDFDAVMGMMTGAYNTEDFSAFRPPLMMNGETGCIAARPGAQRLAVTSGGTIPDRGLYTVVLPEGEAGKGPRRVGELDEEMVYESRVGDVITLGTLTWQIKEITRDRVVVTPAPGRTARLPFWHEFGHAIGGFLRDAEAALQPNSGGDDTGFSQPFLRRLQADGLDGNATANLAQLLREQRAATTAIPTDRTLIIEQCPDEEGDWRVIVHSPFGRRVHEPWAMAISHRIKQRYGFDGQTYAADDGIILRLPDGVSAQGDLRDLVLFDPDDIVRDVETQVGESVLFAARFRECAARSLFLPRERPGKRVPLWQQRLRASQLLNAARTRRNFPLLLETARECLQDVYDLPSLRGLMGRLNDGSVALSIVETKQPSPFAENLLFGYVGQVMYQYDVPQAERSAQLLSVDPQALERLLGSDDMSSVLDTHAIDEVEQQLASHTFWNELASDDIAGRVTRYAKTHGPFSADDVIRALGFDAATVVRTLDELTARGDVLHGRFTPDASTDQWMHAEVFRRVRALSLSNARKAIRPVRQNVYQSFLLDRQGIGSVGAERYEGVDGLLRVIEQLEGVALPLEVWETSVFPARVRDYRPGDLDELLSAGEITWVGTGKSTGKAGEPGLLSFYTADSIWLRIGDTSRSAREAAGTGTLPDAILDVMASGGAYRADQLADRVRQRWNEIAPDVDEHTGEIVTKVWSSGQFEQALWSLVWQGAVTNSSLAPVRALNSTARAPRTSTGMRRRSRAFGRVDSRPASMGGLWMAVCGNPASAEQSSIARVETLLDRYGVIAQPLIDHEGIPGGFSALYSVLRRMEEHGLVTRGMFVQGFGAAQFAARETVDKLRRFAADDGRHQVSVAVATLDPASLAGSAIAWPALPEGAAKPARRDGTIVVFEDGAPAVFAAPKAKHLTIWVDNAAPALNELVYTLQRIPTGSITIGDVNGQPCDIRNPWTRVLHQAGFTPTPRGMTLYR